MRRMIGFAGMSHLGIVTSIVTASKGFDVVAFDDDRPLIVDLTSGSLPIYEPGLDELRNTATSLSFTADPADLGQCSVVVVAIDIPTNENNECDTAVVDRLVDTIIDHVSANATLVILSQVRPGYTRRLAKDLQFHTTERGIRLFYQVETLVFGRAVERASRPERFIVGCAAPDDPLPEGYSELLLSFGCPILPMRYESAELAKISINLFLTASICTANVLAGISEGIGADWNEIAPALRLDQRIGRFAYLTPGLGIAGGNLERDLTAIVGLAAEYGSDAELVSSFIRDSQYRSDWALRVLSAHLASLDKEPIVALWGLAYKENTKSLKNSPALRLVRSLPSVRFQAFDPLVAIDAGVAANVSACACPISACEHAIALVVMTPWPQFSKLPLTEVAKKLNLPFVIDPFGCLSESDCSRHGLRHRRIGMAIR